MPGFLPFYGLLYLVFGQTIALNLFAVFNLVLHIFSSFFVFKLSKRFVKKGLAFLVSISFVLYPRLASYGYLGMTETMSAFALVMSVYLFILWRESPNGKNAFGMSLSLTLLIFLKPIAILYCIVIGAYVLFFTINKRKGLRFLVLNLVFFFLMPTACLTAWTWRNYVVFNKVVPLTPTLTSSGADQAFRSFCRRTGQQFQSWQGKDARVWFCITG